MEHPLSERNQPDHEQIQPCSNDNISVLYLTMVKSVHDKVKEQSLLFRKQLPELMPNHAGRWVVFLDGGVKSLHDTQEEAYAEAANTFGLFAGFVVAKVEKVVPRPMVAAIEMNL